MSIIPWIVGWITIIWFISGITSLIPLWIIGYKKRVEHPDEMVLDILFFVPLGLISLFWSLADIVECVNKDYRRRKKKEDKQW